MRPYEADLDDSVRFVVYELQMLHMCAIAIPPQDGFSYNLWQESLALHSRVLRDFFFTKFRRGKRHTHETDIVAVDYFACPEKWAYNSDDLPQYLREHKGRMDCALAHLSTERIKYEDGDKYWSPDHLYREIFGKWFEFYQLLSADSPARAELFKLWAEKRCVPLSSSSGGSLSK